MTIPPNDAHKPKKMCKIGYVAARHSLSADPSLQTPLPVRLDSMCSCHLFLGAKRYRGRRSRKCRLATSPFSADASHMANGLDAKIVQKPHQESRTFDSEEATLMRKNGILVQMSMKPINA